MRNDDKRSSAVVKIKAQSLQENLCLPPFQPTVEIHWGLIIAGQSVGSAACFKNPWCQSLIFLGEPLISCIVPGNHGLFFRQKKKKKKIPMPKLRLPSLADPHLCWEAARWPLARRCQRTELKLEPPRPPRCFFRLASVMKGSILIQVKEIICRPSGDYKTMLVLMSQRPDFGGLIYAQSCGRRG